MDRRTFLQALAAGAACAGEVSPPSWTSVADRLIQTPVESYPFDWGEGVQMMGLMRAARAAHNARYVDYVEKWAAIWEAKDLDARLNATAKRPGYCGHWSPASAVLYLYQQRRKPAHLKLALGVADFIRKQAERNPEGGLGHWHGSHQFWVDTLYMACPLLAGTGSADDAAKQLIVQAGHLRDERTGLFYHMWDWQTGAHSEGFWGRGNGWVLMSLAETLEALRKSAPQYGELVGMARKLAHGLEATQDGDGLWHTVLDDRESYPECSATTMFVYGLLKLIRLGVLPKEYARPARKAWQTVNARYVQDGLVTGVSAGTGPSGVKGYLSRPVGTMTWGTGAYLLAASEISRK